MDDRERLKREARLVAEVRMLRRELEAARSYAEELEGELLSLTEVIRIVPEALSIR
jgi:hypothetical protein